LYTASTSRAANAGPTPVPIQNRLSRSIIETLVGWIFYGQLIVDNLNLSLYINVFQIFKAAAKKWNT
jgi:hypothetical protein